MSLAVAIVISTLLAILAWQVDKRSAWKRLGKVLGALLAIGFVGGALITLVMWWQDQRYYSELHADADRAKRGDLNTYWDVPLGASRKEVMYLKGSPAKSEDENNKSTDVDTAVEWIYTPSAGAMATIRYDANGRVIRVACGGGFTIDCGKVAGMGVGASEAEVLKVFGPPSIPVSIRNDGLKSMQYGPETAWLRFNLREERVVSLVLGAGPAISSPSTN